jgi:hypothetical protein
MNFGEMSGLQMRTNTNTDYSHTSFSNSKCNFWNAIPKIEGGVAREGDDSEKVKAQFPYFLIFH